MHQETEEVPEPEYLCIRKQRKLSKLSNSFSITKNSYQNLSSCQSCQTHFHHEYKVSTVIQSRIGIKIKSIQLFLGYYILQIKNALFLLFFFYLMENIKLLIIFGMKSLFFSDYILNFEVSNLYLSLIWNLDGQQTI